MFLDDYRVRTRRPAPPLVLAISRLAGPESSSLASVWPKASRYLVYLSLALVCLGLTRLAAVERQYFAPSPITGLYPQPGEFADPASRNTDGFLVVMALPETAQPVLATGGAAQPAQAIIEYTVNPGDTVYAIADRLGVSVESIIWANNLTNENYLQPGQVLQIPAVSGVIHTVQPGETLEGIAQRYGVDQASILAFAPNGLVDPNQLQVGQKLVVPGGRIPEPPRAVSARTEPRPAPVPNPPSPPAQAAPAAAPPAPPAPPPPPPAARAPAGFGWPTVGPITQYFSAYHRGIDIAPPYGTPVRAAAAGVVVQASGGWNGGYGTMVVVDHGNGFRTLYAHLSRLNVSVGQTVEQGEVIGAVGTTGIVTGPHLHFEVYRGGVPVNPLSVLP